jgi:hypothetical protein
LLNDTEVKEWIERETPSAASGAGQKGEFMAFRPQRLVQVLRGIGELHRAKLDQLRFGEDGKPSWGESTSVQESKWSAEFKSLHQQLNYLLADLARQGAPQDVLEMIAASVESLEGIKGVRASFFDEVFSGLLRGREAVRRDFETRVAKMVATGETLFKAEAQGGADDPSSRVPANTLTESGDEPEPGEGTSGANSTPAADPQTKGKSMARPKYVPWPRLSDVNPANLHEYRDWLQKVIAGWREEIGSRIGENAKRAGERKTDLRDCLKAAVLHADRLGLAEVVSAHRDWLDLLGFLFAEQNPGTVLRDLRAIERTVDGKLAAAPTGKQAEGRAKAGAGSLGQIIASPKPGEPAGEITSAQSFPLLAAECYELLAIVCDSREPVEIRDLPKALAGDPLILCEHHRYVKTFNPIIEDAERRAKRRKKGYIVGSNTMPAEPTHVRITKLGRACLASYRLKSRPQQGAARVVNATDAARDKVFISYSHKDSRFLNQLLTHLKPLERAGRVTHWSDRQIRPGSEWFDQIKAAIASSKVAILLVTKDFLASDFIHEHELGPLLKEAEQGGVKILWVLVRACSYTETPLRHYQAVLPPDKPLAQMRAERDIAWVKICEEVKKAANP